MTKRIVLTAIEIEAVLAVAGNALATETFEDAGESEAETERMVEAYERGVEKLRAMQARKKSRTRG